MFQENSVNPLNSPTNLPVNPSPKMKIKLNKDSILIIIAVVAVIITAALLMMNMMSYNPLAFLKWGEGSNKAIAQKAIDYINTSVLQQGQTATLGNVSEESGLVKFDVQIAGTSYTSYITKDGKLLFPQAIDTTAEAAPQDQEQQPGAQQPPVNQ